MAHGLLPEMEARLVPTGTCWCGCGAEVDLGSFFAPGHDKRAEARLIMEIFGGVPQFLVAFGRGPGGSELTEVVSMQLSPDDGQLLASVSALVPVIPRLTLARIALRIGLETIRENPARALAPQARTKVPL